MLRFGRMAAQERWNGCPVAVVEKALGLLQDALRASFDINGRQVSCIATDVPYPIEPILADALTFDRYGEYDVVYMYRPMEPAPEDRVLFDGTTLVLPTSTLASTSAAPAPTMPFHAVKAFLRRRGFALP